MGRNGQVYKTKYNKYDHNNNKDQIQYKSSKQVEYNYNIIKKQKR